MKVHPVVLSTGFAKRAVPCLPLKQTELHLSLNIFPDCDAENGGKKQGSS